jgi:transcriptional regulator with XRE-family HTH domain
LLTPQEMQERRARLGMNQQELAEQLGVAKETISRWETGAMIQSRAMDNLLRLFFESEEDRTLLQRRFQPAPPSPANRVFKGRYSNPEERSAYAAAAKGFDAFSRN